MARARGHGCPVCHWSSLFRAPSCPLTFVPPNFLSFLFPCFPPPLQTDWSWSSPAIDYLELYHAALKKKR